MNLNSRKQVREIIKLLLPKEEIEKLEEMAFEDHGLGFDKFGMEKETTMLAYAVGYYLYQYYFRAETFGIENVPLQGRTIIASNHSGVIPFDATLIGVDMIHKLKYPRGLRTIVDLTSNNLPFSGVFLNRVGQILGTRKNFEYLMDSEQLVLVFPEGAKGSGKMFKERYQLRPFNVGHVEFSLRHKAPLIPTAVIGGEEQMPNLYNVKPLAEALGTSMVPVTLNMLLFGPLGLMLPFPTKYRIYYGEPIRFYEDHDEESLRYPDVIKGLAEQVQSKVQSMINKGLEERKSVFF